MFLYDTHRLEKLMEGRKVDPELVFVDFVVKHLVDHPQSVRIEKKIDENGVLLELFVEKSDLGRVIGRKGVTAQSIRTLLRALGSRNNAHYSLKIIDDEEENQDGEQGEVL